MGSPPVYYKMKITLRSHYAKHTLKTLYKPRLLLPSIDNAHRQTNSKSTLRQLRKTPQPLPFPAPIQKSQPPNTKSKATREYSSNPKYVRNVVSSLGLRKSLAQFATGTKRVTVKRELARNQSLNSEVRRNGVEVRKGLVGQSWENFEVVQTLGIGLFGKVKLAKWITEHGRACAVKVVGKKNALKLGKVTHLISEKNLLLSLNHPFIVKWYSTVANSFGTFQDETNLCFVMEYVPGGELYSIIR